MNGNFGFPGPVVADYNRGVIGPYGSPILTKQMSPPQLFQLAMQDRSGKAPHTHPHARTHACTLSPAHTHRGRGGGGEGQSERAREREEGDDAALRGVPRERE